MNLDLSIFNWALIQNFLLKGLWFSVTLTVVATLGGIFFGTLSLRKPRPADATGTNPSV